MVVKFTWVEGQLDFEYDYDAELMREVNPRYPDKKWFTGWSPIDVDKNLELGVWVVVSKKQEEIVDILNDSRQF